MLEAMKTGDADVATAGLSEDLTTAIGTDAEEWWEGYDTSAKAFRAQLEASGGLPIEMTDVRGYEHDGMGWFEARGSVAVENAAAAVVRMTRCAPPSARRPGEWSRVHASAGIPNAEPGVAGPAHLRVAELRSVEISDVEAPTERAVVMAPDSIERAGTGCSTCPLPFGGQRQRSANCLVHWRRIERLVGAVGAVSPRQLRSFLAPQVRQAGHEAQVSWPHFLRIPDFSQDARRGRAKSRCLCGPRELRCCCL